VTQRILITGITGQDGSFLAHRLSKTYDVHGIVRRSSCDNTWRLEGIKGRITLHQGDVSDMWSVARVVNQVRPNRIFNLADQDDVRFSFDTPQYSMDVTAASVMRLLECVRSVVPRCMVFQPVSATVFGDAPPVQTEQSELRPMSPYAIGKATALYACRYYRRIHDLHITCGILFNHHSPRRKRGYLIDTICSKVLKVVQGEAHSVEVYDPEMRVDVGYAKDFMQLACDLREPDDFLFCTGKPYMVSELVDHALQCAGVQACVRAIERPMEGPRLELIGDNSKLFMALGHTRHLLDAKDMISMQMRSMLCGSAA